jgi:predicted small secreted protein
MREKARLLLPIAALAAGVPMLSLCCTVRGAGEDLSAAGHSMTDSADAHTGD